MKTSLRILICAILPVVITSTAWAANMADVIKAQVILGKVLEFTSKYQTYTANVVAPTPLANNSGKYFVPYNAERQITEWATKTLNTQIGAAIGAKAGEEAGKHLAAKVPFGGLASGLVKKKGKEMGALAAIGGAEFVKKSSSLSFNNLDDYAVYLHVTHGGSGDFSQALAAAMAIYPELEGRYDSSIRNAYQRAQKAQDGR
jgi:hypothetical protein